MWVFFIKLQESIHSRSQIIIILFCFLLSFLFIGVPFTTHKIKCSDNVSISAWMIHQKTPQQAPTIIYFHGNAGNIGLRLPNAVQMYHNLGCNVFLVEYRGYGDSDDAKPNEKGLKLDAEAAYQYLLSSSMTGEWYIDTNNIFVFGRSLGGAVAFHLAKYAEITLQRPLRGILVENTFTSISKMVDHLMPAISPLKFLVLRMDWNSERLAPFLQTPILYLAGDKDELVPHSHMVDLYQKSKQRSVYTKMHVIRGGTHNESWVQGGRSYYQAIKSFMSHVVLHGDDLIKNALITNTNNMMDQSVSSLDECDRRSSLDATCTSVSSMEVSMGGERSDIDNDTHNGAIPIMPKTIAGMAKEATKLFTSEKSIEKKKKQI